MILDRQRLLPKAMQVHLPSGNRHVYMFDIANAKVNNPLDRFPGAVRTAPYTGRLEARRRADASRAGGEAGAAGSLIKRVIRP